MLPMSDVIDIRGKTTTTTPTDGTAATPSKRRSTQKAPSSVSSTDVFASLGIPGAAEIQAIFDKFEALTERQVSAVERQAAAWERIATAIEKRDAKIIDHEHLLHTEGHHAIR